MMSRKRKRRRRLASRRKERESSSATHRESKPATASDYLHHLKGYHRKHPDMVAILYNRESSSPQDYNRNHDTHKRVLRCACNKLDITCLYAISGVLYAMTFMHKPLLLNIHLHIKTIALTDCCVQGVQ
jgi:hypothetical protein